MVRDGTVYVATDEAFLALAATDGSEQWSFEVDFEHSLDLTSPAPWRDALLAPAHDTLYGLSAADGTERWRFSGADDLDRPGPVVDGVALVPERGGPRVYAVDATDGTERWRFETGGAVTVSAVADSTVVVGSEDEHVYGLSLSDGTERWRVATDAPATGRPAARRGTVFVGTNDRRLLALSVVDGSEQWRWETDGPLGNLTAHSPDATVVGGTLYVESGGVVLAVAPADGTERWRVDTDLSGVSVAVAGDAVLLGGDAHYDNLTSRDSFVEVRAVDRATGRRRWKTALEEGAGSFYHDLVVADGRVCFVSGESTVRALSTADGSGQWTYDVGGLVGQPVVAGETLYFGSI